MNESVPSVFGRTNQTFSSLWLSLQLGLDDPSELALEAAQGGHPLDVTNNIALWGGLLREQEFPAVVFGTHEAENAVDENHAATLVSAHIVQSISSLGGKPITFYFLPIRRAWEEFQIDGTLQALEMAREDGLIKHFGLWAEGHPLAVLGWWQFRDAFEALMIPHHPLSEQHAKTLLPLAHERRVGVVGCQPLSWGTGCAVSELSDDPETAPKLISHAAAEMPVMVGVRSADEVRAARQAVANPANNDSLVQELMTKVNDPAAWNRLKDDPRPWVRRAACSKA